MADIQEWLFVEDQIKQFAGFYCNWNSIEYSYERKEIAIILVEGQPIGFMSWWLSEKVAKIQIAEVKPGYRKKGYGRQLTNKVLDYLKDTGSMVGYLHCQPSNSEAAWKKIGFLNFPDEPAFDSYNNPEEGRHLYKILVTHAKEQPLEADEKIQLWAVEPYYAGRAKAKWEWPLNYEEGTGKLVQPIIAPANRKWQICWTVKDETKKQNQIKYFTEKGADFSNFLILESLP